MNSLHLARRFLASCVLLGISLLTVQADGDVPHAAGGKPGRAAGHSAHGEAFNEGPRQRAILMKGTGAVQLKITTTNAEAQAFFNQGVGQLHGFWFFEAERSFRQVAFLDPQCAMAAWGLAMANANNTNRAAEFIRRAVALQTNASPREVLWIESCHKFLTGKQPEKDRRKELIKSLEDLSFQYPDELEAKTFLAFQIWLNDGSGVSVGSRQAADALMNEILAVEPMHPVHHARIHLWNYKKDERALNSAARCGQSAPAIAHMWHMPGHTYSQLKRYDDAAWQQEAAARTDHAHMMAARILPDQIHNFAHNNEWLCRNLLFCGRVREAIDLARNMVELPRHPKYNTLNRKDDNTAYDKNNGSSMLGRNRLFDAFLQFELWPELISLADTFYLEPTELPEEQARRFYALALAYFATGRTRDAESMIEALAGCRKQLRQERFEAVEKAEATAKKDKTESNKAMVSALEGFKERLEQVDGYQGELKVWAALNAGQTNAASEALAAAEGIEKPQLARLHARLGNRSNVLHYATEILKDSTNQAPALALAAHLFWEAGETNQATNVLHQLRSFSSRFDLETPVLARLQPLVRHVGLSQDWRLGLPVKSDVGNRPELDTLGPFRWEPLPAPDWVLTGSDQKERSLGQYRGRPLLMVFYLGAGCVHCIEQLNLLTPASKDFQSQGIEIVAVSTESVPGLQKTLQKASQKGGFPFPIVSDEPLAAFKAFRAYDDFEQMPLHGTFLVDGEGRVRWQDIGPDPFTDFKFLVGESRRLLGLTRKLVAAK